MTTQQLGMSMYAPVITVALSCMLETLRFCANSPMTLTEGFQPFNLVPAGFSSQVLKAASATADYNHISTGGTPGPVCQDSGHTRQTELGAAQLNLWGQCPHPHSLHFPCNTPGHLHPFMVAMQTLLDDWVGAKMELPGLLHLSPVAQLPVSSG